MVQAGFFEDLADVIASDGPYGGQYHLSIRRNGSATRSFDLSDMVSPTLSFMWKANSFDGPSDFAQIEVYDGEWHLVYVVNNGQDDNKYHAASIDLSNFQMVDDFKVRVSMRTWGVWDFFYLDDIVISP